MTVTTDKVKRIQGVDSKLKRLVDALSSLKDNQFTGYVKVNFTQGTIGRVEKFEEILKKH